jgi:hypothetical protein
MSYGWPLRPRRCPHCSAADAWQGEGQLWRTVKPVPRVVRWVVVHECGICQHVLPLRLEPVLSLYMEVFMQWWRACPPDAPAVQRKSA